MGAGADAARFLGADASGARDVARPRDARAAPGSVDGTKDKSLLATSHSLLLQ